MFLDYKSDKSSVTLIHAHVSALLSTNGLHLTYTKHQKFSMLYVKL